MVLETEYKLNAPIVKNFSPIFVLINELEDNIPLTTIPLKLLLCKQKKVQRYRFLKVIMNNNIPHEF